MAEPVALRQLVDLPPAEALRFLDAKGYRFGTNWQDVWQDEHVASFTAAKVAKLDVLRELHVSLLDAMANGETFASWKAGLEPRLQSLGWWGRVADEELTGTARPVTIGPRRLRTIYDTNLRMARATALWSRIWASRETLPYLRYSAVMDRRTRPEHRAWHGTVLPVTSEWWLTHFPPNGWNCRCTVVQLSQRDIDRGRFRLSEEPPPSPPVAFRRRGGPGRPLETVLVPQGIDPGFAYNPGRARARAMMEKAAQSLADASVIPGAIEAALPEILAEFPGGVPPAATLDALTALAAAGNVAALATALADLLGVAG